jgi:CRISPR-associated protein Cas2
MTVIVLEKVPVALRGELTRWLIEVAAGVYIGTLSKLVRDLLWEKVIEKSKKGRCILAYRTNNEQGFAIVMHGDSQRSVVDMEGLYLVAVKNAAWQHYMDEQAAQAARLAQRTQKEHDDAVAQAAVLAPPPQE